MMKNILLSSLVFVFSVAQAEQEATVEKQKFTWVWSIQPKDLENLTEYNNVITLHRNFSDEASRASSSQIYQNFLSFIKELQEAVVTGFNLFGSVATSQETVVEIVEEAVEEMVAAEVSDVVAEQPDQVQECVVANESVESDEKQAEEPVDVAVAATPAITVTFSVEVADPADMEVWNNVVEQFTALAENINQNVSAEELTAQFEKIMQIVEQSNLHGAINIHSTSLQE